MGIVEVVFSTFLNGVSDIEYIMVSCSPDMSETKHVFLPQFFLQSFLSDFNGILLTWFICGVVLDA